MSWVVYGHRVFHSVSLVVLCMIALSAFGYTLACAFGLAPWLSMTLTFGGFAYPLAGVAVQVLITLILCSLVFFLPSAGRIMALEHSHRDFQMSMEDVARAYFAVHNADRAGLFTMSSEFDAVRERIAFLRDHPGLQTLEPEVLELAAQMSETSRELADIYSDEKVTRAKTFLTQRQQEVERQQALIIEANHTLRDIRSWTQQVEIEESIVASQLGQLQEALEATLPDLGLSFGKTSAQVVPLAKKPAAE